MNVMEVEWFTHLKLVSLSLNWSKEQWPEVFKSLAVKCQSESFTGRLNEIHTSAVFLQARWF